MMTPRRSSFASFALILLSLNPTNALVSGFRRTPPVKLSEEIGCSPTLSFFSKEPVFFDPLDFADDDNFAFFREAELKHGRVCMVATIGMLTFDGGGSVMLSVIRDRHLPEELPKHLATDAFSPLNAIKVILVCGILETQVFVQQDDQDMPGDYGIGYFGSRNKARHERSLISELENGRLAMIAFLVQVIAEAIFRKNCWILLSDVVSLMSPSS